MTSEPRTVSRGAVLKRACAPSGQRLGRRRRVCGLAGLVAPDGSVSGSCRLRGGCGTELAWRTGHIRGSTQASSPGHVSQLGELAATRHQRPVAGRGGRKLVVMVWAAHCRHGSYRGLLRRWAQIAGPGVGRRRGGHGGLVSGRAAPAVFITRAAQPVAHLCICPRYSPRQRAFSR